MGLEEFIMAGASLAGGKEAPQEKPQMDPVPLDAEVRIMDQGVDYENMTGKASTSENTVNLADFMAPEDGGKKDSLAAEAGDTGLEKYGAVEMPVLAVNRDHNMTIEQGRQNLVDAGADVSNFDNEIRMFVAEDQKDFERPFSLSVSAEYAEQYVNKDAMWLATPVQVKLSNGVLLEGNAKYMSVDTQNPDRVVMSVAISAESLAAHPDVKGSSIESVIITSEQVKRIEDDRKLQDGEEDWGVAVEGS